MNNFRLIASLTNDAFRSQDKASLINTAIIMKRAMSHSHATDHTWMKFIERALGGDFNLTATKVGYKLTHISWNHQEGLFDVVEYQSKTLIGVLFRFWKKNHPIWNRQATPAFTDLLSVETSSFAA